MNALGSWMSSGRNGAADGAAVSSTDVGVVDGAELWRPVQPPCRTANMACNCCLECLQALKPGSTRRGAPQKTRGICSRCRRRWPWLALRRHAHMAPGQHSSSLTPLDLGTPPLCMQALAERLAATLPASTIQFNTRVQRIDYSQAHGPGVRVMVETEAGEQVRHSAGGWCRNMICMRCCSPWCIRLPLPLTQRSGAAAVIMACMLMASCAAADAVRALTRWPMRTLPVPSLNGARHRLLAGAKR